jgi:hypothetical protein
MTQYAPTVEGKVNRYMPLLEGGGGAGKPRKRSPMDPPGPLPSTETL